MQRRSFIRSFLLVAGGTWLAKCTKLPGKSVADNAVKGRVTANGIGLAGVIVSDGYSVVVTDKGGSYTISIDSKAKFIFVSTPSGYKFAHEKYIARHYHELATVHDKKSVNFDLHKLETDDTMHNFLIWADPQVKNEKDVAKMMQQSVPDVQQLVKSLPEGTLLHGVCVGDLVWDNHSLFPAYSKAIEACGVPFFQAIGNHDMDYNQGGDDASDDTFESLFGPTYYSFNRGKVHYVVLDDVYYLGKDRTYKGYINENQLAWLKKDLELVSKDHLLIVCLHIPVHSSVENRQALYDIVQPFNCHIMSGHTHYNKNVVSSDRLYEHNHGTVCGAWWTGSICEDGTPDGYAMYEVNGTDLKWFYKSTGQPVDYQLSLFMQKNKQTAKDEAVINVWNWDPKWKVEYWADGIYQGTAMRKDGYDPLSVLLYKGDALPKGRTFAEPRKTDHLFLASLPDGCKEVKVVATDRFGKKYELVSTV